MTRVVTTTEETMHSVTTGLAGSERIRLALTEAGMAMLCGAMLAQTAVITSLEAHRDIAWSWFAQVMAIGVGIGIGAVAGWRTVARRRWPTRRATA
jgi:hypothetical protein